MEPSNPEPKPRKPPKVKTHKRVALDRLSKAVDGVRGLKFDVHEATELVAIATKLTVILGKAPWFDEVS